MTGFRIAVCSLLAVGALIAPGITEAHKKSFATTLTAAAQNKNQVEGAVASRSNCLPQRRIELHSSTGALEGTTTTDAQGSFRIQSKDLALGTHFVTVRKRVLKNSRRHKHTCAAVRISFVFTP
jgi:hypothetical protein